MEKIQLLNTVRDFEGNHILLDIEYKSVKYTIGSVYGANTNEGINMYNILRDDILKLKNSKIILGGDWNCVWDTNRVEENLDVLNMANVPSSQRTNKIHETSYHWRILIEYFTQTLENSLSHQTV